MRSVGKSSMINEKELEGTMALLEKKQDAALRFFWIEIKEMAETIDRLWKVARAARRWQRAYPGADAALAESDMMDALDALNES